MPGLSFLSKKSWHTGKFVNQEKVYVAEQKVAEEQKKVLELQKQIFEERELDELRRIQQLGGHKGRGTDGTLDWMYMGPAGAGNQVDENAEEYLLGKVFKPKEEEKSDLHKLKSENQSGALYLSKISSSNDAFTRLHEDPLLSIRLSEKQAREKIINNPLKLEKIKNQLMMQLQSISENKSKKRKRQKKDSKDKKRKRSKSESSSSSESEDEKDYSKLESSHKLHVTTEHSARDSSTRDNHASINAYAKERRSRSRDGRGDSRGKDNGRRGDSRDRGRDRRGDSRDRDRDRRGDSRDRGRDRQGDSRDIGRDRRGDSRDRGRDRRGDSRDIGRDKRGDSRDRGRDRRGDSRDRDRGRKEKSSSNIEKVVSNDALLGPRIDLIKEKERLELKEKAMKLELLKAKNEIKHLSAEEKERRLQDMETMAAMHDSNRIKLLNQPHQAGDMHVESVRGEASFLKSIRHEVYNSGDMTERIQQNRHYIQSGLDLDNFLKKN